MATKGYRWYFGTVIACLRNQSQLTQQQYAEQTNLTQSQVSRIESGNLRITIEQLAQLAHPFGLSGSDLYKIIARCFATYRQSDTDEQRLAKIKSLCDFNKQR